MKEENERIFSVPKKFTRVYVEGYVELEDDSSYGKHSNLLAEASNMVTKAVYKMYEIPFTVIKASTED